MTHPYFVEYMTYFMDTTKLMRAMHQEVKRLGIPIEITRVESFDAVDEPIIFNCAGLGAKQLNQDEEMIAVRGHMFYLSELAGAAHQDYMIYTKVKVGEGEQYVYMFPKVNAVCSRQLAGRSCHSCIGGTFIQHTDQMTEGELVALDQAEFQQLYQRAAHFFHGQE